jgi:hypothetical protein
MAFVGSLCCLQSKALEVCLRVIRRQSLTALFVRGVTATVPGVMHNTQSALTDPLTHVCLAPSNTQLFRTVLLTVVCSLLCCCVACRLLWRTPRQSTCPFPYGT